MVEKVKFSQSMQLQILMTWLPLVLGHAESGNVEVDYTELNWKCDERREVQIQLLVG